MPVRFEPQAPMAPGVTAGAGAAQQYSKDLPSLVSLYESLLRGGGGHGGGGGRGGPVFAPGGGTRNYYGGGRGGGGGAGHGGPPAQVQALNQAEIIRLAKLQAAAAGVDADDSLAPEEKQRLKAMIQQGIQPLQARQQMYMEQQRQMQQKQMAQQAEFLAALRSTDHNIQAAAVARSAIRNPDTGKIVGYIDPTGHFHKDDSQEKEMLAQAKKEEADAKRVEARQKRQDDWEKHQQDMDNKDWDAGIKAAGPDDPNSEPSPEKAREFAKQRKLYREGKAAQRAQQATEQPAQQGIAQQDVTQPSPGANLGAAPLATGQRPTSRAFSAPTFEEAARDILGGKPAQVQPDEEGEE